MASGLALEAGYIRGRPGVGAEDLVMAWAERIGGSIFPEHRLRYRVRFGTSSTRRVRPAQDRASSSDSDDLM